MKVQSSALLLFSIISHSCAFTPSTIPSIHPTTTTSLSSTTSSSTETKSSSSSSSTKDPLLIRAARGETTERTPVWMMRQAGRHIAEYRELCKTYPTFRQRSEIPEVAVEVSLQPWRNYKTDGCILFSDILTPLPGMGVEFEIDEKRGPIVEPMRSWDSIKKVCVCIYGDCIIGYFFYYIVVVCVCAWNVIISSAQTVFMNHISRFIQSIP